MPADLPATDGATQRFSAQMSLRLPTQRATPPRPPQPTAPVLQSRKEQADYLRAREHVEARSVSRGLLLLALLALAVSLFRAGADRAIYAGWWKVW